MSRYVCAWLITLLFPAIVLAQCPTQETAILYLNGVDTTIESAIASRDHIRSEVLKVSGVLKDCVTFDHIYNTNEPLFLDFLEAGIQKANEQGWDTSEFWRWFFRLSLSPVTNAGFASLLVDFYANTNSLTNLGLFVLGDQVEEHLAEYRKYLNPPQNKRLIIVSHSQGSLYANEEWNRMTDEEKSLINIIAVATPTDSVAGDGPYTTLDEDRVAKFLFPLALPANASNEEPCGDDWTCHGFKESYMRGDNSRTRIVEEIVALLPAAQSSCRIDGVVTDWSYVPISGGKVRLRDNISGNLVAEATSDSNGHYCIKDAPAGYYFIGAYQDGQFIDGKNIWIQPGLIGPMFIILPMPVLV